MVFTLLAGLLLVGVAAAFAMHAISFGRLTAAERLRSIEMYGFGTERAVAAPTQRQGLNEIAESIGRLMFGRMSGEDIAQMRRDLLGAGLYMITPQAYLGYRFIATAALVVTLVLFALGAPSVFTISSVVIGAALGWRLPSILIERRAVARNEQIDRELPELIDLLVVSVEAGVGLAGAQQMISTKLEGPLGDELRLMIREQSMGLTTDQSLSNLLERCETPSVRSFTRALQQGERLGVSIGKILRDLAYEMRIRRRQTAEERAQKAPIKILFPLIFLIFPAMFIVLLGPAAFRIAEVFGGN